MRTKFFKKVSAAVMALTMVLGMVSVVPAAHVANNANIASGITWDYFSLCPLNGEATLDFKHNGHLDNEDGSRAHPYCWYHALTHLTAEDGFPDGQIEGKDFATKGWVVPGATASKVQFYAKNTGWDGQYNGDTLVSDNPWGLRLYSSNMTVEKGRTYTLSFKYSSDMKGTATVYKKGKDGEYLLDDKGNKIPEKDENGKEIKKDIFEKHIGLSIVNPKNGSGLDLLSYNGCSSSGFFVADARAGEKTITVSFKIPKDYAGNQAMIQFAAGAYVVTYPEELALSGSLYLDDVKVLAGTQYAVKYVYGSQSYTEYVNAGDTASGYQFGVKGKTFKGYSVSLSTPITKDTTINCQYVNTPKPGKAKVKFTAQKKKVKLKLKKAANVKGFEIKYAGNKKMKKAKTRRTTKTSYTIKGLKAKKKTYITVRAYNLDSMGQRVYSKKVLKKTVKVK